MYSTAEVRWFSEGDPPKKFYKDLVVPELHLGNGDQEKQRYLYLMLPEVENLGIKLRGKYEQRGDDVDVLEIKRRQNKPKSVTFHKGATGYIWNVGTNGDFVVRLILRCYKDDVDGAR